jgi:DNA-binding HxlR family transcriptional regulator
LKKAFPSLSDQVLGKRLKELVEYGLIDKTILEDTVPPQSIYSATSKGIALLSIIDDLHVWGMKEWD